MTADPAHVEHARKVADAVLYEGYLLYPYRRSAQKNRTRFQFGVLMPDDDTVNFSMFLGDVKEPMFTIAYKRKK